MHNLNKLIREALKSRLNEHDCGCGCSGKCGGDKAPMINENLIRKPLLSENLQYHVDNKKPLTENTFRYGSEAFLSLWSETRKLYSRNLLEVSGLDKDIITETNLGEYGIFEGQKVPLDLPMIEEAVTAEEKDSIMFVIQKLKSQGKLEPDAERTLYSYINHPSGNKEGALAILRLLDDKSLNEAQMLDGYEVDFFHTKANVYANIEIPSENPTFEDDIQIKGTGKTEEEAFIDLKQNYENYKKTGLNESEYKGKDVQLNKPKRGGSKKFFVYVMDPKTKRVKKVSFGAAGGGQNLAVKIRDPKARKAFAARQNCDKKKDRTKPGYWSCNLPRYANQLGLKGSFSGYW